MVDREEILKLLWSYVDKGVMLRKGGIDGTYNRVQKDVREGKLYTCSVQGVIFTDIDARDTFEGLYNDNRIMPFCRLAAKRYDARSYKDARILASKGEISLFECGSLPVLYIV
jgi:hypothetical protein